MGRAKIFAVLIMLFVILAVPAYGSDFSYSFENINDADSWDGGTFDDADSSDGKMAYSVINPYGDIVNGRVSHYFSYLKTISLNSGEIYKISMDAKNQVRTSASYRSSGIRIDDANQIIFEFRGIPSRWTTISQFFMVSESGDYSFGVELMNGSPESGFMVDNIRIEKIDLIPESLTILGDSTLTIPYSGEFSSTYRLGAYSDDGEVINIPSGLLTITARDLPAGVSFDISTNTVTVNEYCPNNASFILECQPSESLALDPAILVVNLSRNILKNSDFSDGDEHWIYEPYGEMNYGVLGNYLTLYTETPDLHGYRATLRPDYQAVLIEGAMYVLRAKVRIDGDYIPSVYSRNVAEIYDGEVTIDLLNLPVGNWVEVIAAFTPEASGIYDLTMNFYTSSESIIDIGELTLSPETPEDTYITIHAPGNISIPNTLTTFPLSAYVRDQAGSITESECILTLYPERDGISLSRGGIRVSPDVIAGEYEIRAVAADTPLITETLTFSVSAENVGDGGFEEKRVNEWWAAAAPAVMTIQAGSDGKYARIVSDDDYAIVLNNSYMKVYANTPYAFTADIIEGYDHVITAFIETTSGDRIPVIQSSTEDGRVFELFQTEEELVGRLMLYISSGSGSVEIGLDNIELFRAVVRVSPPVVAGIIDTGYTVDVAFDFFNNLDDSANPSDCTVSWFVMNSTAENEYIGSGNPFVIPDGYSGRYLYCEVTPICKLTGLSGTAMRSVPMIIGGSDEGTTPTHPDNQHSNPLPEIETRPAFPILKPAHLGPIPDDTELEDIVQHWAAADILLLYNAGIVDSVDERSFNPSGELTRAELAEIICRAFSASGGNHSFYDVPKDSRYSGYIASMSALGIMSGVSDTRFDPDAPVTREQLTVVLIRVYEALGRDARSSSLTWFYDYKEISDWARSSVGKAINLRLVNGTTSYTFAPKQNVTRAETCAMLVRLLDLIERLEAEESDY